MSVEKLSERAVSVAERLLKQDRTDVLVQITRQGMNTAGKLATGLVVKADPETTIEALELLADKLERDALGTSFTGLVDA